MEEKNGAEEIRENPQDRLLREKHVRERIPVSHSEWWKGVREGRYPKPIKLSERVTCWRESDIRKLIEGVQP